MTHKLVAKNLKFSPCPLKTAFGDGMVQAEIELNKDTTATLYLHSDALPLLEAAPDVGGEAVAWEYERATEISEGMKYGDSYKGFERKLSFNKPKEHPQFRNASPLFRAPPDAAKRIAELEKHRDLFASGIAEIAIELDITDGSADLSGPQLLMLVDNIKTSISNYSQLEADKARLVDELAIVRKKLANAEVMTGTYHWLRKYEELKAKHEALLAEMGGK